jgi:hypothetical protein
MFQKLRLFSSSGEDRKIHALLDPLEAPNLNHFLFF